MNVFSDCFCGGKLRFFCVASAFSFLCFISPSHGENDPLLGFSLSLSSKRALERATALGLETLEKGSGRDGRKTVTFKGAAAGFAAGDAREVRTRLTFFKGRIESVTLFASLANERDALAVEEFVARKYGEPAADEEIFSYRVKSWNLPDSRVVVSYSRGGVLKLDHIHLPTRKDRYERDIQKKKIKDTRPPAQRMIDGDFSKPDYR